MSTAHKNPIIIRRINKDHHEYHGGMWKVAYADFVTAMMTFFLLMWLINSTPKENLEGIAKYFTPTMSQSKEKGIGFKGGTDANTQNGKYAPHSAASSLIYGSPISGPNSIPSEQNRQIVDSEKISFINIMSTIQKTISSEIADNIAVDISPEGLRIQIMDSDNRPMFKPGTDEMEPYMSKILTVLGDVLKNQPYHLAITGHTASLQDPTSPDNAVDYWRLSALRANKVRSFLSNLIQQDQVTRIMGTADKEPFDYRDPFGVKNMRTTITLITNSEVDKTQQVAPDGMLDE